MTVPEVKVSGVGDVVVKTEGRLYIYSLPVLLYFRGDYFYMEQIK